MKVFNSVEFPYSSKYDVIVEHFGQLLEQALPEDDSRADLFKRINEFVGLQYPVGSLSTSSKRTIVNTVLSMEIGPSDIRQHVDILRSLQLHTRLANFYNSNQSLYGQIVSKLFENHLVLLQAENGIALSHIEEIKQHLNDLKTFCQYNLSSTSFEANFARDFMPALCKLVIKCQSNETPVDKEFFSILQLIFFNTEKTPKLKEYLKNYPEGEIQFFDMFPQDHNLLIFLDALVATYHNDKDMMNLLIPCVYEKMAKEHSRSEILVFRHVLYLLRKYDVNMSQNHTAVPQISSLIMAVVAKRSQTHPVEVMDLICQAVQWNPVIIQDDVLVVIVHFMSVEKDSRALAKFAEMLRRVMSTYTRLNRFEKRTGKLLELVKVEMDKLKVTQPLKRKIPTPEPTSNKKQKKKKNDSTAVNGDVDQSDSIISLLEDLYTPEKSTVEPAWDETWSSLTNIWPKSVAKMWAQSVSTLVSKTSFVIWKALLVNMEEALTIAASRSYDGQSILYIKFVSCFFCEYLSGSRVLEHTDQQYDVIEGMCGQTKELLKTFGRKILETEHNAELVSTFLSVVAKYGSFETSLLYYHPDSMEDGQVREKARAVFEFLTAGEWSLIEQRVINFGKENCRFKFTDLNFRKVKSVQLCEPEFVCRETKSWNKSIISDYGLLTKFAENCVYFEEFIADLTRKQKTTLAKTIFEGVVENGNDQRSTFVEKIAEQYEMVEVSALVILGAIADTHLHEGALSKSVDFNAIIHDKQLTVPDVKELMAQQGNSPKSIVDEEELLEKIKLIQKLPLAFLKDHEKENLYSLHLLLSYDLSGHPELQEEVLRSIRLMRELGYRFDSLKHLDLVSQLSMLTTESGRSIVLDTVGNYFGDAQLKQVKALLKKFAKDEAEHVDLILLMGHRFSLAKKNHKNEKTMSVYKVKLNKLVFQIYERDMENQKAAGLLYALNMYLNNKENLTEPNASLGKLCLKLCSRRPLGDDEAEEEHKSKILSFCFQHMVHFALAKDDLEAVLQSYWLQVRTIRDVDVIATKTVVDVLGLLNVHTSTENYISILMEIAQMAESEEDIDNLRLVCKLMQSLCPSMLNQSKGLLLSEFLKKILDTVIMKFTLRAANVYDHPELILDILKCFSVAALNRQIVMSQSLFSNILSFSLDINFKRFRVTENNTAMFERIHLQLSQLCTSLIQARSLALTHAMPQFVSLMKDLVHTICAFRNERGVTKQKLSEDEVKMLSGLAHRLEPILNGFADRDHLGRKVAPYLLVYVINEMIFNPNSTTLYPGVS